LQKQVVDATPDSFTECYLFVGTDGTGFALIAADDCVRPVLGYSLSGTFPLEEMPAHIAAWIDGYQADIAALRQALRAPDEKAIVKAFVINDASDVQAARESTADMVLLDAGLGEGKAFDWSLLEGFDRPYFLAGGLDANNVAEALDRTGAAYVDTSSGIETDGVKDPAKMRAFAQAVRAWDEANPRLSFLESLHPEFHEDSDGE
jgi:hypothetical protein